MSGMSEQSTFENKEIEIQNNVISLFQFIREMNRLKNRPILNIDNYPWTLILSELPDDSDNIRIYYCDRVEEDDDSITEDDNLLLSVHKPVFHRCPLPLESFEEWLVSGWEDPDLSVSVYLYSGTERDEKNVHVGIFDENKFKDKTENWHDQEYFGDAEMLLFPGIFQYLTF